MFKNLFKKNGKKNVSAVIVAAGSSTRMGSDKCLLELKGEPVIVRTVRAFQESPLVDEIVVVSRIELLEKMADLLSQFSKVKKVVAGGETRAESSLAGVSAVSKHADYIAIHDAARPLVSQDLIENTIKTAFDFRCCVPGLPSVDTLRLVDDKGYICADIDREKAVRIQTPQVFDADIIKGALTYAVTENKEITDDSSAVALMGYKTQVVTGDARNIKLTTPADVAYAEAIL